MLNVSGVLGSTESSGCRAGFFAGGFLLLCLAATCNKKKKIS